MAAHNYSSRGYVELQDKNLPSSEARLLSAEEADHEFAASDRSNKRVPGQRTEKLVRVLRAIQGLLSSILSLGIAVIQAKVYVTYMNTRSTPGAWPKIPQLLPTLLLLAVSTFAFIFDVCLLVGYLAPSKRFRLKAFNVANACYSIVTTAKTFSYTISSAVLMNGRDFGNASGQNADLWSWTCTDQAATHDKLTQASTNCDLQHYSSYFTFATIGVEAIGALITVLLSLSTAKRTIRKDGTAKSEKEQVAAFDGYTSVVSSDVKQFTPSVQTAMV